MGKGLKRSGSVRNGQGDAGRPEGTMGNKGEVCPSDKDRVKSVGKRGITSESA